MAKALPAGIDLGFLREADRQACRTLFFRGVYESQKPPVEAPLHDEREADDREEGCGENSEEGFVGNAELQCSPRISECASSPVSP